VREEGLIAKYISLPLQNPPRLAAGSFTSNTKVEAEALFPAKLTISRLKGGGLCSSSSIHGKGGLLPELSKTSGALKIKEFKSLLMIISLNNCDKEQAPQMGKRVCNIFRFYNMEMKWLLNKA
jgi:hypothetical protein